MTKTCLPWCLRYQSTQLPTILFDKRSTHVIFITKQCPA